METRKCKKCGETKPLTIEFFYRKKSGGKREEEKYIFVWKCKVCKNAEALEKKKKLKDENPELYEKRKQRQNQQSREWNKAHPERAKEKAIKFRKTEKFKIWREEYKVNNREAITKQKKEYRAKDPKHWQDYQAEYYEKNKDRIKARDAARKDEIRKVKNAYQKKKRQTPEGKIRSSVSRQIHTMLTSQGSSKGRQSFFKYVNWSEEELRDHLESQWEPWMNWENYGKYKASTWDDDDQSTWTWSIDHIIPQSDLPYKSMKSKNFKKSWAKENLRPLSAKQNVIDGVHRVRHAKKK